VADTERRPLRLTLFTRDEATRTVEDIRRDFQAAVQARRELRRVQRRLEVLELAMAGASPENPDAREQRVLAARRTALVERIRAAVERVQRPGCVIKDLDQGLVDFYSLDGDRLIFLCWRLGEAEVAHWHTLDGGFATRKPLPD